ncbi:heparanase [Anticarsia gemmatalis]|uniref:heparanase n=1 Tax=Anticarsia gemmatalis TaxID=129554 RepID=UPI003F76AF7A
MATPTYLYLFLSSVISLASADTYSVKIVTEQHVNLVDSRFVSFTIDPKYLFSTSEKYSSKECICMASSLTPAYLRIAGPSTAHMSFHNTTISINDVDSDPQEEDLEVTELDYDAPRKVALDVTGTKLAVTHREWRKFVYWAKSTGFDLVFALNNEERTASSMWDPNTALNILTVAEKAKIGDMFWELGYECTNQSIEEYLNDLETLRVIMETFPPGRTGEWKVVGGDVTKCLQADSKSDFKDYIMLSNDMMDALLLNGNSSSHELERMSESDHMKLLRLLSHSKTPLWLTETNTRRYNQLERAADWLASLGYSAKNGFSVHYRELEEEEMYEPTLSFYMALLFKNLVGEKVLNVEMDPEQAILFGHCTSLRRKPVPGAVTLFGVNMDDEPARFSLKLSKREEGGDIMQFILGLDHSGNIVVNGRAMYYEGDIKPVVKRVRPYKTLLINLPPKSFGFWVIANTKIDACQDNDAKTSNEDETATEDIRVKRSVDFDDYANVANLSYDFEGTDVVATVNTALESRVNDINKDLEKIAGLLQNKNRFKRDDDSIGQKLRRLKLRSGRNFDFDPKELISNILQKAKQSVDVIKNKGLREVRRRFGSSKIIKRHSKSSRVRPTKQPTRYFRKMVKTPTKRVYVNKVMKSDTKSPEKDFKRPQKSFEMTKRKTEEGKISSTTKPSVENHILKNEILKDDILEPHRRKRRQTKDTVEISSENDLQYNEKNRAKLWRMLKQMHDDLKDISEDEDDTHERIVLKTELSDDMATIKVKDSPKGLIKSTMKNMFNVLEDLNKNLNRFWGALSLLD